MTLARPARRALSAAVLLAAACSPPAPPAAPAPAAPAPPAGAPSAATAGFVVRMGRDTLGVERVTRSPGRLEGTLVTRSPRTTTYRYTAELGPGGEFRRLELAVFLPGGSAPDRSATAEYGPDSATVVVTLPDSVIRRRVGYDAPPVPVFGNAFGIYEQAARLARAAGGDTARFALVPFGGTASFAMTVREDGPGSLVFDNLAGASVARVAEDGTLLGWDGTGSTFGVTVERVPDVDVEAAAASFAARDQAGRPLGALSPRDTARAVVDGARVEVDYGRPSLRGRTFLGGVVPWNEVWRTGANAATGLRTDRDLVLGGVPVPAGAYTLFSLPTPDGWTLIVNRQTGQWGTEHDPARDLARIPMRTETLAEPVETFTIAVQPAAEGGVLSLAWGDTRAWVPFTVR